MRISHLAIHNYKSLRSFSFEPADLSVVVGANASGKSNFADALDFLSEVYRHGLEVAIGRKGGYENIAFRKVRRSKQPVSIRLTLDLHKSDFSKIYGRHLQDAESFRIVHEFSFVARGSSIRAEFEIVSEQLSVTDTSAATPKLLTALRRTGDKYEIETSAQPERDKRAISSGARRGFFTFADLRFFVNQRQLVPKTDLLISFIGRFVRGMHVFLRAIEGIRVFQISPTKSREFGVPTPTPELDRSGANLPAVVDLLQKRHKSEWRVVLQAMRSILPDLAAINVGYTSSRTLGLFFKEHGSGRPWSVDEVSDGTVQTLALLVAIFDPASTTLVIEEPENSVHPWIIRHILDACRTASAKKQIIVTTHSPIVINSVSPEQVWIIWKSEGESKIAPLTEVDKQFLPLWQEGEIPTFEYIDAGAVPEALPPAPEEH